MRPKSLILLSLALGCGLVASIGINEVMSKVSPVAQAPSEKITVFVAKKEINLNDLITEDMLATKELPKEAVHQSALTKLEDVKDRRARQRISVDEVILDSKLLPMGENARPSEHIPAGKRTVAIRVNAASTGGFLIKPGDHVDLMVYLRKNASLNIKRTQIVTFMQNIKVFAVDNVLTESIDGQKKNSMKTISVLVTLDQAETVTMASNLGTVSLVLRSPKDEQIVEGKLPKLPWHIKPENQRNEEPQESVAETEPPAKDPVATQSSKRSWLDVLGELSKNLKPVERKVTMQITTGKGEVVIWEIPEGLLPRRISEDANAGNLAPSGFSSSYLPPPTEGKQGTNPS